MNKRHKTNSWTSSCSAKRFWSQTNSSSSKATQFIGMTDQEQRVEVCASASGKPSLPNRKTIIFIIVSSVCIPPGIEITIQQILSNANTIAAGDLNAHNVLLESSETDKLQLSIHHTNTPTDSDDIKRPITLTSPRSDHLSELFNVESKLIDRQEQTTTTKTRVDWDKYKEMKQVIEDKQNKWRKFCTELNHHRYSDTVLWRKISLIESANTQKPSQYLLLKVHDQHITTPNEVANKFAEQLKQTFPPKNEFDEPFKATREGN
ncbi:hypothetical protein BpHYR1_023557 [Brachionus plicatilis]|uniref:Uncharacterized protein n=1 Tax=Brachionus plicatilis TaxID=10195 RepID=A0A3M7PZK0_BRAPC|nr:hypothetical protein BpHYR1_023557 [Brachionus plicatilis]